MSWITGCPNYSKSSLWNEHWNRKFKPHFLKCNYYTLGPRMQNFKGQPVQLQSPFTVRFRTLEPDWAVLFYPMDYHGGGDIHTAIWCLPILQRYCAITHLTLFSCKFSFKPLITYMWKYTILSFDIIRYLGHISRFSSIFQWQ